MFIAEFWLPIVVAAVAVFISSSLIHMVFKWHNSDYHGLANEDEVRAAIRAGSPKPVMYAIPYCADFKQMGTPEMQKKLADGPVAWLTVRPNGMFGMGPMLGQWFVWNLVWPRSAPTSVRRRSR